MQETVDKLQQILDTLEALVLEGAPKRLVADAATAIEQAIQELSE